MKADPVPPVTGAQENKAVTHTPGPWEVDPNGHDVLTTDGNWVAIVCVGGRCKANARLIAAVPDYWDAAERLTTDASELEGDDAGYVAIPKSAYDALMRAHAKANGNKLVRAEGSPV